MFIVSDDKIDKLDVLLCLLISCDVWIGAVSDTTEPAIRHTDSGQYSAYAQ